MSSIGGLVACLLCQTAFVSIVEGKAFCLLVSLFFLVFFFFWLVAVDGWLPSLECVVPSQPCVCQQGRTKGPVGLFEGKWFRLALLNDSLGRLPFWKVSKNLFVCLLSVVFLPFHSPFFPSSTPPASHTHTHALPHSLLAVGSETKGPINKSDWPCFFGGLSLFSDCSLSPP